MADAGGYLERVYPLVLTTLREMGLSPDLWPEVVQGLRRLEGLDALSDEQIVGIVRRRARWASMSEARRESRRRARLESMPPRDDGADGADSGLERKEQADRVRAALETLDGAGFEILWRRTELGASFSEIADAMGMSEHAVRRKYLDVLARLRSRLGPA
jgi:RNA polymerase sigma factor (sigma-70 family)